MSKIFVPDSGEKSNMAADLKRGRRSPRHGREDEDGVDSDSCGSDAESEDEHVVRPYEHDPKFKSKEELEHFLQGCDNVIQSESDSEDENVDYEGWQGTRKVCSCGHCEDIASKGFEHLCCQQVDKWKKNTGEEGCLTEVAGFEMATNVFAVSNMCYQLMRRRGRTLLGNRSLTNNELRFGFYRSAHLFIGNERGDE